MKIIINGKSVEVSSGGVTIEQVNEAISSAITGAIEEVYYGTESDSTETTL